ncbi:hypothetical protein SEA_GOCRAZY_63 [Arthrobacter phage GoCrazy]|uniref:Uncharacterized protein n=3 Tax=Mudcatvirus TaxID=1982088 RepID=A0A222Z694_9CAUD|nr:hypothetical protein PQB74_gp66 [Arthrobacter phage Arcadia]YP_010666446.1 hypothetical protein PQB78_gp62 [Arthrobacter phage Xenomorph]YP_010666940.1 hypothetical protein PQB83_gp62 [Arthrobacter phage KeaneyLin]ASR80222.1 hypothetical protein SEA_ELSA_66 [Arthrobacter phage Elsa]ASR80419.1 hypothetical protein SEA_NASON_66 [Arthrobacter phage Nason]QXO13561.1 hypothetical protein SEA_GOCRAZY_63 [Arthrobacter phage GoCrazy]ASR80029.1 hypothetical protein SEA_ARCADIA_66 [Arthrobacter phag
MLLHKIKFLIYRLGARPKRKSVFYSASLATHYALRSITHRKK